MRALSLAITLAVVTLLCSLALAQDAAAPQITAPSWGADTTFEFGIYENDKRVATAYYRILKEKAMDRDVYRLKYVGRNDKISEATECVVDAGDMSPLRSTRKVVYQSGGKQQTFYQDTGYAQGGIVLRKRYEGKDALEKQVPTQNQTYDYEELIWLLAQLNIPEGGTVRFDLFSMLTEAVSPVIINVDGIEDVKVGGKKFSARVYSFSVGTTPYKYWMVMQSGKGVPARIDMASTRFENLKLDPKKVTKFPSFGQSTAKPKQQQQRTFGKGKVGSQDKGNHDNGDAGNQDKGKDDLSPYLPPPPQNP